MGVRYGTFLVLIFWCAVATAAAVPPVAGADSALTVDLAVAPFANNTGQSAVHTQLMPVLEHLLVARDLTIVASDSLRPLLRRYRVRSRGWISRRGAELIAGETGANFLLLGSWDVLQDAGNIEVGVSMRLLDLHSLELVGAVSVGGSGEDHVTWLDQGRIDDVGLLAKEVLTRALDQLWSQLEAGVSGASPGGCHRVAIIPLDNFSAAPHAGEIVTNILLSQLMAAGYFVVEPGFVRELGLAREVVNRGGVDRASAQAILDRLGACQVITGAVQQFAPARGLPTVSVPLFSAGLRVGSTSRSVLLAMCELEGTGSDTDGIFQLGRVHAITPLVVARIHKFVAELPATTRKDSFDGHQKQ